MIKKDAIVYNDKLAEIATTDQNNVNGVHP